MGYTACLDRRILVGGPISMKIANQSVCFPPGQERRHTMHIGHPKCAS